MSERSIRPLAENDIGAIVELADRIWHQHYRGIISLTQIDYMLAQRYQPGTLRASLEPDCWLGAWQGQALIGFAHALADAAPGSWKLDKLYVDAPSQRQGVGRALLAAVIERAIEAGSQRLVLRVNKHNQQALAAYARYGFRAYGEDVLDIGDGFVMDDYLLELPLQA